MRKKAMRSRCLGSRLAWILKTKPEKRSSEGSTKRVSLSRPCGDGEISQNVSSSSLTPKLLTADPKKTGATSPDKYVLRSKASYTPSIMSSSSRNSVAGASPMIWSSAGSEVSAIETTSSAILVLLAENKFRLCW